MDVARHGQLKGVLTTWLLLINDETRDIVSEEVVADIAADNWKERIKEIVGKRSYGRPVMRLGRAAGIEYFAEGALSAF